MMMKLLTSAKDYFLELLFPIKCAVCERETGDSDSATSASGGRRNLRREKKKNKLICTECLKKLSPSLNFYCPLCEAKTADGKLCFSCNLVISHIKSNFYLDRLIHPFSYKDRGIQKITKAFKYRFIKGLEGPLGRLMTSYLEKLEDKIDLNDSVIVPIPLHKRKFNQRGYNQSELIAEHISKYLNLEVFKDCLIKNKTTKDQVDLKEKERLRNLKNVFVCQKPELISGRKILLVDDVYTTGATMAECAKVLKESGAKEVIGLAIARG